MEKKPKLRELYEGLRYKFDGKDPVRRGPELRLKKTEYHVGIDHESAIFQSLAFWKQYLTWTRLSNSWPSHHHGSRASVRNDVYQMQVPDDIRRSSPPYSTLPGGHAPNSTETEWADTELMFNTITKHIPVTIHMTAEKQFRNIWWQRLWFQPHAENLRFAAINRSNVDEVGRETIGGHKWQNAQPPEAKDVRLGGSNGAW